MFELLKMNLSKSNQLCTTIFSHIKFSFISLFIFFLFISISSCNEFFFSDGHSNDKIETLMRTYVKAWSDGDVNKITDHIYEAPLTIRYQDSVIVLGNKERIRFFLNQTFENWLIVILWDIFRPVKIRSIYRMVWKISQYDFGPKMYFLAIFMLFNHFCLFQLILKAFLTLSQLLTGFCNYCGS